MNEFKILFLGDSCTGAKTSLIIRMKDNCFSEKNIPTIGIDFKTKMVHTDFGEIKLKLWDVEGQEKFRAIQSTYVKGSDCIILGYDVTNRKSFESIRDSWYNCVGENIAVDLQLIYLVGNKIDKIEERVISDEEGESLANDLNMKYFGVSAKTGENVDILLNDMVNSLIKKFPINKIDFKKYNKEDNKNKTKIESKSKKNDDKLKSKEIIFEENEKFDYSKKFKRSLNKYVNF